jgi:DNA replication protein DnaC
MKKLIIPERFVSASYEKDVSPVLKEAVEAIRTTRKGLYLYGRAGTGKTHSAYAICKKFSDAGTAVRAFNVTDLLKMVKEDMLNEEKERDLWGDLYFGTGKNFLDSLNSFKGLVLIDDLGVEKDSEWVVETIDRIIDKKYEDVVPLIITSNLSLNDLGVRMGDRIASRIAQMCEVVEVTGLDRRLTA